MLVQADTEEKALVFSILHEQTTSHPFRHLLQQLLPIDILMVKVTEVARVYHVLELQDSSLNKKILFNLLLRENELSDVDLFLLE